MVLSRLAISQQKRYHGEGRLAMVRANMASVEGTDSLSDDLPVSLARQQLPALGAA